MDVIIVQPQTVPDKQYRILVTLQRSDRPAYYKYHCPRCTMPVAELINADIVAISDLIDMSNQELIGVGTRCEGRYEHGHCRIWHYFSLGD